MLRRTATTLAPSKGNWTQKLLSVDFAGINWTQVGWKGPYTGMGYPITLASGIQARQFTNPILYGSTHYRMTRNVFRQWMLMVPAFFLLASVFGDMELWNWMWLIQAAYNEVGVEWPIPQWIQDRQDKWMKYQSFNKPGNMHKHASGGGLVTVPGSEKGCSIPQAA